MKIGIVSDIHGNVEACRAVLDHLDREGIDELLCLGDVVGYGADPGACVELIREKAQKTVVGNHDHAAVGLTDPSKFNQIAREALTWTERVLSPGHKEWLSSLPFRLSYRGFRLVHSTPLNPQNWDYLFTVADLEANFEEFDEQVCFLGHSHIPDIFCKDSEGQISISHETRVTLKPGAKYLINIGSVGQPRDGVPLAAFGVYDTDGPACFIIRVDYDIPTAQEKILAAGLPPYLAYRLSWGR